MSVVLRGGCLRRRVGWSVCRGGLQSALGLRRTDLTIGSGRAEARPYIAFRLRARFLQSAQSRENHFAECGRIFAQHLLRELGARCTDFLRGLPRPAKIGPIEIIEQTR